LLSTPRFGKKPIHVRKEVVGYVANRLQAALYREIVYLIEQGVLDIADSDAAVCWGPGLRWGVMGPNLLFHLGGGQGGIQHFMEHISGPLASWWKDLGTITEFSPQVKQKIIDWVIKEAGDRSIEEFERERHHAARTACHALEGGGNLEGCIATGIQAESLRCSTPLVIVG